MEGVGGHCLAVRMVLGEHGDKKRHECLRGLMRSPSSLTYKRAQLAFDGNPEARDREIAKEALMPLWAAYQALAQARDKRDPLNLDLPERRIILGEDGKVKSIA